MTKASVNLYFNVINLLSIVYSRQPSLYQMHIYIIMCFQMYNVLLKLNVEQNKGLYDFHYD